MKIIGQLIDIHNRITFSAEITIEDGLIKAIKKYNRHVDNFILPGLIDAHIHIESSMLAPGAFAAAAVPHGTIGVVTDPHEIANVLGIQGIKYMIKEGEKVPLKFWFGAPSCVPATDFESSGAVIGEQELFELFEMENVKYLSEMMNYPGVIYKDERVLRKLEIAKNAGRIIDGHAPGLRGEMLEKYIKAGITTDHECSTLEEAVEKISYGMKIIIREGSAARNLNALKDLFRSYPESVMLGSDDLHPEMLQKGHINKLIAILVSEGYDTYDVIRSATMNPVKHYGLDAGMLRIGDRADFIITDDPSRMNVIETWIDGTRVYEKGKILFRTEIPPLINNFNCRQISQAEISVQNRGKMINVIKVVDGELLTERFTYKPTSGNEILPDINQDILKIIVKERYKDNPPVTCFIKGFGLKKGAFASSVAHDSHNIICVGADDLSIVNAVNKIVEHEGGLAVSDGSETYSMKLGIAGIMSEYSCDEVAEQYKHLSELVRTLGCTLSAPFMTLSFMALLVIPKLKIGDKGLFDVEQFKFVPLSAD